MGGYLDTPLGDNQPRKNTKSKKGGADALEFSLDFKR